MSRKLRWRKKMGRTQTGFMLLSVPLLSGGWTDLRPHTFGKIDHNKQNHQALEFHIKRSFNRHTIQLTRSYWTCYWHSLLKRSESKLSWTCISKHYAQVSSFNNKSEYKNQLSLEKSQSDSDKKSLCKHTEIVLYWIQTKNQCANILKSGVHVCLRPILNCSILNPDKKITVQPHWLCSILNSDKIISVQNALYSEIHSARIEGTQTRWPRTTKRSIFRDVELTDRELAEESSRSQSSVRMEVGSG